MKKREKGNRRDSGRGGLGEERERGVITISFDESIEKRRRRERKRNETARKRITCHGLFPSFADYFY